MDWVTWLTEPRLLDGCGWWSAEHDDRKSNSVMSFNEEVCHKRLLVICLITNVRLFASCTDEEEEEEENGGNFIQPFIH